MSYRSLVVVFGCLFALCLIGGAPALAQNQEDAAEGQEVAATEEQAAETPEEAQKRKFSGEIVVTSTRRELKVREIPASVSVTEGFELESIGATTMDDYASQIPGVNFIDDVPQRDSITVRGIATATYSNMNQAPVATYINETPVTDYFSYTSNFDVIPFDVERVEFLKGPQGTLYGAASLGGTIRTLYNRPNLDRSQGALHLTASTVESGSPGYVAQGMFNVPLAKNKFAIRGVLSHEDNGGWIDHATRGEDYNSYTQTSGRLMASWTPSDKVRLDFSYMTQNTDMNAISQTVNSPDFDNPAISDLYEDEFWKADQSIYNFSLYWDLGFADLMSSTSLLEKRIEFGTSYGPIGTMDNITGEEVILGFGFGLPVGIGDLTSVLDEFRYEIVPWNVDSFFQEIRLVSKDTGKLDWIAGVYYADAEDRWDAFITIPGIEDRVNELAPPFGSMLYPDDYYLFWVQEDFATELAFYGELGIDLSTQWKLNLGGRYTDYESDNPMFFTVYGQDTVSDAPTFTMNVFSPKVSLSYRSSADLLWYGLISRGYRTGGPNNTYIVGTPDPDPDLMFYETDNLWNYETGIKKTWAGGRVTTDFSLFYLDWSDIQLEAQFIDYSTGQLINGIFNTGKAKSLGVEAYLNFELTRGLHLSTALMWNQAELTEDSPPIINLETNMPVVIPKGSQLPNSPEWSATTSLQYFWNKPRLGFPFIGLTHFYKDTYIVYMPSGRGVPSYNLFNLQIGATVANELQLTLRVANVLDERSAILNAPSTDAQWIPATYPETWNITRPRTISLSAQWNF
jgi:outer membrane receptor protein involved in Fe transport